MTNDQVTIAFEGDDVPLVEFAKAMGHFSGLLEALSQEISPNDKVQWTIYDLQAGSAIATARGLCDSMEVVGSIANAYLGIGKALESGEAINYSSNVQLHVNGILGVLNGKVSSLRFETQSGETIISHKPLPGGKKQSVQYSFGTVSGIVQTLTNRRSLRFILFDPIFDKAISCYLGEGQEEMMRRVWGKRVVVCGRIGRDIEHGRPVVVREIQSVREVREVTPGNYRKARGILAPYAGAERAEVTIRRLRDAE